MSKPKPDQPALFDALTCDALDLIDRLGDEVDGLKWPERLHTLYELIRQMNLRAGMTEQKAALDARDRCIVIGDYLGGRAYNIPRGDALRLALRDKQIWLDSRGNNHEALARQHDLDVTHLYRILRQQKALYQSKLQGRLFDES